MTEKKNILKDYIDGEIQALENDLSDIVIRLEDMKLKQQYKTGRLEAYKATLEHLLAEENK